MAKFVGCIATCALLGLFASSASADVYRKTYCESVDIRTCHKALPRLLRSMRQQELPRGFKHHWKAEGQLILFAVNDIPLRIVYTCVEDDVIAVQVFMDPDNPNHIIQFYGKMALAHVRGDVANFECGETETGIN